MMLTRHRTETDNMRAANCSSISGYRKT